FLALVVVLYALMYYHSFPTRRSFDLAQKMAKNWNGEAILIEKARSILSDIDIVIGGTHGEINLIHEQELENNKCERTNLALNNGDRKSTRMNSSHVSTTYAVFCFKKK